MHQSLTEGAAVARAEADAFARLHSCGPFDHRAETRSYNLDVKARAAEATLALYVRLYGEPTT